MKIESAAEHATDIGKAEAKLAKLRSIAEGDNSDDVDAEEAFEEIRRHLTAHFTAGHTPPA